MSGSNKKSRSVESIIKFLLILLSLGVTVFIVEVAVRFLPPPYNEGGGAVPLFNDQTSNILACHEKLGWIGQPNFHGVVNLPGREIHLNFNASGMHDTGHTFKKPPGTFRILMLGDSFVHAIQVDEKVTAHQILEDYLNQQAEKNSVNFEVVSGGVASWGTGQELVYYREEGRRYQPDLVLLMLFLGNDFENNLPGNVLTIQKANCYSPYFALCDSQLNPEPLPYAPGISNIKNNCSLPRRWFVKVMGTLYQHSRLYQQLDPLIHSYRPPQLFGTGYPNPFWALYIPNDEPELQQAWQVTQGLITQLRQEVRADGAQLAVAFWPWSVIIEFAALPPSQQEAVLKENPTFAAIDINRPNTRLAQFFSNQNIPFMDLTSSLIAQQATQERRLHFVGDSHWTVAGNRFVADVLAQWLFENDLVPR